MQKILKRFALLTVAAIAVLCFGIFAAACDNGDDSTDEVTEFTITVYYSDGTTVVDGTKDLLLVRICDASGMFCYTDIKDQYQGNAPVNAKGVATFDIAKIEAAADDAHVTDKNFVLHVVDSGYNELELKETVTIKKDNPTAKIVLKDRTAPQA